MAKKKKNPNAVALGRLGGLKRAETLSEDQRKEIAQKAVAARNDRLSPAERSDIARKAAAARNASLSPAERSKIAKLAVTVRERKRKLSRKEI